MCFKTKGSKIKIAKKDIICYKTVRRSPNGYFSMYQDFDYKCNKEYSGKSKLKLFLKWLFNLDITKEAYHSYTWCNYASIPCIIPKGSLYLIDKYKNEYCSTSIIIKNPKYYIVSDYKINTDIPISHKLSNAITVFVKKGLKNLKTEFNNFKTK